MYTVFNTLLGLDQDFNVIPELARSWTVSDDGLKITLDLQQGATFHDGTAFDSSVVKWNIDRILDPEVNSPQLKQMEAILEVETPDENTAVLVMKYPFAPMLANLAIYPGFIVSPTAVQEHGEDFGRNPVGTGPFKFVEWVPDSHITVERFEDYWEDGKPYLDKISFRFVPDPTVKVTMLRSGEVDLIDGIAAQDVGTLEADPKVTLAKLESLRWIALQWQWDTEPFNNAALRQAIAYGIDREEIKKVIYLGTGRVATHPDGGGWWYDPSLDGKPYSFDPEKARQKLSEAGYASGFKSKFTTGNSSQNVQLAQLLQRQLEKIGVEIEIELVPPSDSYSLVVERKTNWTNTFWSPRPDPHARNAPLFGTGGFNNTTGYSNPEVDRVLEEAAKSYDTNTRKQLYSQMEQMVAADAPYIFLHWPDVWAGMSPQVQNFVWIPDLIMRVRDLWLKPN